MKTLVDTSVWIEFFNPKPRISKDEIDQLATLIREAEITIIEPIRAEILSGSISPSTRNEVNRYFDALDYVDLNWSAKETWNKIIDLSLDARAKRLPVPGVVDRMILLSARHSNLEIWSLDQSLLKLAKALNLPIHSLANNKLNLS